MIWWNSLQKYGINHHVPAQKGPQTTLCALEPVQSAKRTEQDRTMRMVAPFGTCAHVCYFLQVQTEIARNNLKQGEGKKTEQAPTPHNKNNTFPALRF